MFKRHIIQELEAWKNSHRRKPLILRGARQVGKTTAVHLFASSFEQYIYLNLEKKEDRDPFLKYDSTDDLLAAIFFTKEMNRTSSDTLIFIDEIQESPKAISMLRYFYEEYPQYYVIAAGSLLEALFDNSVSFPVGRVEYRILRPLSFEEYLYAMGETTALEQYNTIPIAPFAHDKLLTLFHNYTLIGGMPEVVAAYAETRELIKLKPIYESLIQSYLDDAEKYAKNPNQTQIMRHAIRSCFFEAGKRIKFQGFGRSNYGSREIGEVLRTMEKAMLIHLVYPTTQTSMPFLSDLKRSPRLHILDTGMLNYFAGIQNLIFGVSDLNSVYQGHIAEHIVGQELLAKQKNILESLRFWVREKKDSVAELDYLCNISEEIIPVEVKSGATGRLRSLHLYMNECNCNLAIRLFAGKVTIDDIITPKGKRYRLLSIPYYLTGKLDEYIKNLPIT